MLRKPMAEGQAGAGAGAGPRRYRRRHRRRLWRRVWQPPRPAARPRSAAASRPPFATWLLLALTQPGAKQPTRVAFLQSRPLECHPKQFHVDGRRAGAGCINTGAAAAGHSGRRGSQPGVGQPETGALTAAICSFEVLFYLLNLRFRPVRSRRPLRTASFFSPCPRA